MPRGPAARLRPCPLPMVPSHSSSERGAERAVATIRPSKTSPTKRRHPSPRTVSRSCSTGQSTKGPDGYPLHGESGYLRPAPEGGAEFFLAHPFGVVEVCEGTPTGTRLDLSSTTIAGTSTKAPLATRRVIEVVGDELHYDFYMAAVGNPLEHHLEATLNCAASVSSQARRSGA